MQVRPLIGMGGDKLLPAIAGIEEDSPEGQRHRRAEEGALQPACCRGCGRLAGARSLLEYLRDRGIDLVIATSADDEEMDALLECAGVDDLVREAGVQGRRGRVEARSRHRVRGAGQGPRRPGIDADGRRHALRHRGGGAGRRRRGGAAVRRPLDDHDLRGALYIFDDPQDLLDRWQQSADPARVYQRA